MSPCRRVRETDVVRQGFHRLGNVIVEVVEGRAQRADRSPWRFFGLVFNVEDLDRATEYGADLIGAAEGRPCSRAGGSPRSRREAGLGHAGGVDVDATTVTS